MRSNPSLRLGRAFLVLAVASWVGPAGLALAESPSETVARIEAKHFAGDDAFDHGDSEAAILAYRVFLAF
ncbi:MAG: hypothetical protein O3A96_11830 [Proteobacteria bacterium]|nr:hypothetical protein [Pseudomonadota bacterium]